MQVSKRERVVKMDNYEKLNELFDQMVPPEGKALTVAGEMVRAAEKLIYRYYNDGDLVGRGYGNHTCNAPARYLEDQFQDNQEMTYILEHRWFTDEPEYEEWLEALANHLVAHIRTHTSLMVLRNDTDMLSYYKESDREDSENDEEGAWRNG